LLPYLDLGTSRHCQSIDLDAPPADARQAAFDNYITITAGILSGRANSKLYLFSLGGWPRHELGNALARMANPAVPLYDNNHAPFPLVFDPGETSPEGSAAVPLGYASAIRTGDATTRKKLVGMY